MIRIEAYGLHTTMSGRIGIHRVTIAPDGGLAVLGWESQHSWTDPRAAAEHAAARGLALYSRDVVPRDGGRIAVPSAIESGLRSLLDERSADFARLVEPGGTRYRWSNGSTAAVEFCARSRRDFERAVADAHHVYRRWVGDERLELHVMVDPDAGWWMDPVFPRPTGGIEIRPGTFDNLPAGGRIITTTRAHVITLTGVAPDECPVPVVRGTDYVLVVGPGRWHGDALYRGCMAALGEMGALTGFLADVFRSILGGIKIEAAEPAAF